MMRKINSCKRLAGGSSGWWSHFLNGPVPAFFVYFQSFLIVLGFKPMNVQSQVSTPIVTFSSNFLLFFECLLNTQYFAIDF